MAKFNFLESYNRLVSALERSFDRTRALQLAVGGEFEAVGELECNLLIALGLQPEDYVIDVGCGSGRLAKPLADCLEGRYLGTDIVADLLDYARALVPRSDWRFELVDSLTIPEGNEQADFVCLFSVITHLLHEESYLLLAEATRVLKPGGRIIVSFLEFAVPSHWAIFESTLKNAGGPDPLTVFIGRDAIAAWAQHLGLNVEAIFDGDKPHIPLRRKVVWDNGAVMEGKGNLGQSVCVLGKPRHGSTTYSEEGLS